MSFMPEGSLSKCKFTEDELFSVFRQGLEALSYLHKYGILHRDIKPRNVLLRSRIPPLICLSDFGLSKKQPDSSFCGTPPYCAPELFDGSSYTPAADMWSWGLVVF